MDWCELSIDKETYNAIKDLKRTDLYEWAEENLPSNVIYGYGLYGVSHPFERGGKYFLPVTMGSSCD